MYFYRVEYTFWTGIPGMERSTRSHDIYFAEDCQEAVDLCRDTYSYLEGLRIESVWKEIRNNWWIVNAWN